MALRILIESVWAIFGNLGQALKVSVVPFAFWYLCVSILLANPGAYGFFFEDPTSPPIGLIPRLFVIVLIPLFVYIVSLVAVSWHRCILRNESVSVIPTSKDRPVWLYGGQSVIIWALSFLAVFAVGIGLTLVILTTLGQQAIGRLDNIFDVAAHVVFYYLFLRLGLALVGTAVEKPLGIIEAWRATRSSKATILGLAVLLTTLDRVFDFGTSFLVQAPIIVDTLLSAAFDWVTIMVGISVLTVFYSYRVEGRH